MRIIAGTAKGKKLLVPSGTGVRPTADRVREAIFSSLGSDVAQARVLDLFAGSGALGLEALSRGADFAVFVESERRVREILRRNIAALGFEGRARLIGRGAFVALGLLEREGAVFDLVFLDPPYSGDLLERVLRSLASSALADPQALILAEHPSKRPPVIPNGLVSLTVKKYGTTSITALKRACQDRPSQLKEDDT